MQNSRFNLKRRILLTWQRRSFRGRCFCIVSNNCWGAHLYQKLKQPYQTPFVGLYLMPDCYLNLLEDFHALIRQPLRFKPQSRHDFVNRNRVETGIFHPIGELAAGVEIQFLHYATEAEAEAKWSRRLARIPRPDESDKLFFKLCDRDGLQDGHLERFEALSFKNKVGFSATARPKFPHVVHIPECKEKHVPHGLALADISRHYFDALNWLSGGTGKTSWTTVL